MSSNSSVEAPLNLLLLNILSIKYSVYGVKCDINYCVYSLYCILCDIGKINVIAKILIKNLGKQKRWGSKQLLRHRRSFWEHQPASTKKQSLGGHWPACPFGHFTSVRNTSKILFQYWGIKNQTIIVATAWLFERRR